MAVGDTLNFTRAAEQCNVAQPSLSRAVKKLEEELGGDLFRRERNRTHLSELGRTMHPLLRQTFEAAISAKQQAAEYQSPDHSVLRVGLSFTVHMGSIAPMLSELTRAFPGLELRLIRKSAQDIMVDLKDGDIEVAIMADIGSDWDRLDRWSLFEEGFVLLTPPSQNLTATQIADIDPDTVIARPYCEVTANHDFVSLAGTTGRRRRHEASCDEDAVGLVRSGLGVAIMPASIGRHLTDLVTDTDDLELTRTVRAFGVAGRQRSLAANGFLKLLRAADWAHTG